MKELCGEITAEEGTITHKDDGTQIIKYEIDKYDDGKFITKRTDTIDTEGNTIRSEYESGLGKYAENFIYDGKGRVIEKNIDRDNDKIIDSITYITDYDENGNILRTELDRNNDGKIDNSYSYSYDDRNNEVSSITYGDDGKELSRAPETEYNEFNEAKLIKYGDNKFLEFTYLREEGKCLKTGYDEYKLNESNEKVVFKKAHYQYNENGESIGVTYDDGANDSIDMTLKVKYGYWGLEMFDDGNRIQYMSYNRFGQRYKIAEDTGRDSSIDNVAYFLDMDISNQSKNAYYYDSNNDGKIDRLNVSFDHNMDSGISSEDFSCKGLPAINLSTNDDVTLIISDKALSVIGEDTPNHKVTITGDAGDTLKLSQSVIDTLVDGGTANDTYTAGNVTLMVDPDVTVAVI
ncbi:hypothetical protein [Pasteurella atlantica]|uniref:hypothetical protein n=1 Tax=Pasteurellaceae TaxID=712 RepID=UPI0027484088|nr:hypothetical protein [Pasteurella atlantica]MDP8100136.1 hypothetical protein [Pasteurella atlantica]MDP8108052.1 hypothetical protein [Pasteurella atlantica]MDP8117744.1 hypothetical protein [Pasteurella atlantica]